MVLIAGGSGTDPGQEVLPEVSRKVEAGMGESTEIEAILEARLELRHQCLRARRHLLWAVIEWESG